MKKYKKTLSFYIIKKNKKWEIKTLNKILHEYDFKLKNLDDNYNSIIKYFSLIKNEKILERISKLENLLTLSNKRIAFNLLINEIQLGKENVSVERLLEIAQWVINPKGDIPNELVKYIKNAFLKPLPQYNRSSTPTSGTDTSDATATQSDILLNKTAYVKGTKLIGTHVC